MQIAIIAGSGIMPVKICEEFIRRGYKFAIICIKNFAIESDFKMASNIKTIEIGQVGAAIEFLKSNDISEVVMAGSLTRPNLSSILPDLEGAKLIAKIAKNKFLGDDSLLKTVINFFESKGFKIRSTLDFISVEKDKCLSLSNYYPCEDDLENIKIAIDSIDLVGKLDVGQGIVVCGKRIIAIEGFEGTDKLIQRCADYANILQDKPILVKFSKPNQDLRVDIATVGSDTISLISNSNFKGIAIESKNVHILNKENFIEQANENGIFIHIF